MTTNTEEKKKVVFIVDDDSFLLDMYALRFSQAGYQVETALGATIALEKFHAGLVPNVILLDVVMPNMDGFELLEKMNEEKLVPEVPKIYLSNLGQDQDLERGKTLGAIGYIIKANSTPSEVVAKVKEMAHI